MDATPAGSVTSSSAPSQSKPTMSGGLPKRPSRTVSKDGTAVYDRPPSLDMPRAPLNERRTEIRRPTSPSSTTAEDGRVKPEPQSKQRRRPSNVTIFVNSPSSASKASSSPIASSPPLSNLPPISHSRQDSTQDLLSREAEARPKGKQRARVDSDDSEAVCTDSEKYEDPTPVFRPSQEKPTELNRDQSTSYSSKSKTSRHRDEEYQARIERDRLAESDRRQRLRNSREAELAARERAEQIRRDASRERNRRAAAAALEGEDEGDNEDEYEPENIRKTTRERLIEAELAQITRERALHSARKRESLESASAILRSSPVSPRRSVTFDGYAYPSSSSPLSARTSSTTPYSVVVHNPPAPPATSHRRDSSLRARGEAVIAREQTRASSSSGDSPQQQQLNDSLAALELQEQMDEDDMDAAIDAGMQRITTRRIRTETRDRERGQRVRWGKDYQQQQQQQDQQQQQPRSRWF